MKKFNFLIFMLSMLCSQSVLSQIKVSENNRFLVQENGKPFFWLGDTAWELFHRLNREQAEMYLKRRSEQGFTVVQAVALAEFDGLRVPNPYGEVPLKFDDPNQPNEKYFQHVDYIIDKAAEYGIYIAFLPTWGDKLFKAGWGKGPEIFTIDNAKPYGKWLGNRYKDKKNIIWIVGGDRNPRPGSKDLEVWRKMAEGVIEGVGNADKALLSYHPQPNQEGSGEWFHNDNWLDFNMFQNGHCRDQAIYDKNQGAYNRLPTKPFIDGEPIYEDHPVCFNANDLGISNAYDVRKFAYLDLFSGAFGHTYGCHDIWQMYSPYREAVNNPHIYWQEAMELPGAKQMIFVRKLMESRPMLERVPDQSMIVENNYFPADRIQATRGKDYAFVYTASGKTITANLGKITGNQLNVNWFDPRTGKVTEASKVENKGTKAFTPPTQGQGQDWVLILDDSSKNYQKP